MKLNEYILIVRIEIIFENLKFLVNLYNLVRNTLIHLLYISVSWQINTKILIITPFTSMNSCFAKFL